ncbi:MAG: LysR substrate-binding domain-containing protein [Pseudomonadota bacterium]
MDLSLLHTAALVAQHGSFASVARQMDVAPSSVSRSVAVLEDQIGLRLFERSTRHLAITEEGRVFLDRVAPLLEEFDRARDDAIATRQAPRGPIRVTASVAFGQMCLMPLLPRLRAELPEIEPEFLLTDQNVNLVDASIDIAIRLAPAPTGDVISTRLLHTRYHVCAARDYIAMQGSPTVPRDLGQHMCLLYSLPEFRNVWRFRDADGTVEEQDITGPIRISNPLSLREAANQGLGPALLADWLVREDLSNARLVDLFPNHTVTATSFDTGAWLLYPSKRYLPARTRAVIDFFKANLPLD